FYTGPKVAIDSKAFASGALVIAAPMSAGQIHAWLDGKVPSQVFDLRDTSETDRIVFSAGKMHRLQDIFTQIEQTKKRLKPVIEQVHLQIDLRSQLAGQLAMVRPQGWDDLCA